MTSSGHFSMPLEVAQVAQISDCLERAKEFGVDCEWWGTFLEGIRRGLKPEEAAQGACGEWDV